MTNQQIIQAAIDAGLCFPECWALGLALQDWDEQERNQMAKLRRFAELIQAL